MGILLIVFLLVGAVLGIVAIVLLLQRVQSESSNDEVMDEDRPTQIDGVALNIEESDQSKPQD